MNSDLVLQFASIHLLQVSILFFVVFAFHLLLSKRYPHFVFVLWVVFFVKCIVPPVISSPLATFGGWSNRTVSMVAPGDGVKERYEKSIDHLIKKQENVAGPKRAVTSTAESGSIAIPWESISNFLTWLWLIGALGVFFFSILYMVIVKRKIFRSVSDPPEEVAILFDTMVKKTGLSTSSTTLVLTDSDYGPLIFGFLKTYVVIPQKMVNVKSEEMESVLAHELCHIRRKDHWFGLLQVLGFSLLWFHPLVWIASRRFERLSELCCDDDTIGIFQFRPTRYARSLLAVLSTMSFKPVMMAPGIRVADFTKTRVQTIVNNSRVSLFRSSGVFLAIVLLFFVVPYRSSAGWSFGVDPKIQAFFHRSADPFESQKLDTSPRDFNTDRFAKEVWTQMDPFVGRWEIFHPDFGKIGSTEFGFEMNGKILRENYVGLGDGSGHGISYFDPKLGKWKVTWVDSAGAVSNMTGGWNGNAVDLKGKKVFADGREVDGRNSLIPVNDTEFHVQLWKFDRKNKGWTAGDQLTYRRIK